MLSLDWVWKKQKVPVTAASAEGWPHFHFLNGVSLVKVCQNSDGFLLGSARANTCCCGTLVGTVTWRWCRGCRAWCGGATGHPL